MDQMSPEEIRFFLLDLDSKTVIQEPLLVCVHLTKSVTSPAAYWDSPCSMVADSPSWSHYSPSVSGEFERTSRCSSSTSSMNSRGASSNIIRDSFAPGDARINSSSLRWVAACSRP
jgi:hypothetical protein